LLLIALAPACGETSNASDAGNVILDAGIDGGYCRGWTPQSDSCSPIGNSWCNVYDQRCVMVHPTSVVGDGGVEYPTCCASVPQPVLGLGSPCVSQPGLPDDCAEGTYCDYGECRLVCNVVSDCGRAPCNTFVPRVGIGTCAPACDVLTLACPGGLSCYQPLPIFADEEDPACAPHLELAAGEACYNPRQCAAGLTCVRATAQPFELDYSINDGTCRPVCRVLMNDCAPGSSCISYKGTNYGACIVDSN
jgi:hypothetical protein